MLDNVMPFIFGIMFGFIFALVPIGIIQHREHVRSIKDAEFIASIYSKDAAQAIGVQLK